jgi:hypothetical protein
MRHIRTTIAILLGVVALSSCQKRFTCHCVYNTSTPYGTDHDVNARDKEQAIGKCDLFDSESIPAECTLK